MADPASERSWWHGAAIYQIYPRSFADSDGDGVGDLRGVLAHLDHVAWLGVDAVWLSPIYPSPLADGGYDVSDYCAVDPRMGALEDFDELLEQAHRRGIRVLLDWVPNHTSTAHPWFQEACAGRGSPRRDWYHWRDTPNNWRATFHAGNAWHLDERTDQYYLHFFLPEQADLNWDNPAVVAAMHDTLRFWLDRGVDGFRVDVAHCLGKDRNFGDDDRCLSGAPIADFNDQPHTHEILRGIRRVVEEYPGDRILVGEVNIRSTAKVVEYYGAGDELHLTFNFPPLDAPWDPLVWREVVNEVEKRLSPYQAEPVWVLSNHDNSRLFSRYGSQLRRARAAAVLLLTLRGTAFIYQGDELGIGDVDLPPSKWLDPIGRDTARGPIPWEPEPPYGWPVEPWRPFGPEPAHTSARAQRENPGSIAHLYRDLIALRRADPVLRHGDWQEIEAPPGVFAYRRMRGDDARVVVINFSEKPRKVPLTGNWTVRVNSDAPSTPASYDNHVQPEQALLLTPA